MRNVPKVTADPSVIPFTWFRQEIPGNNSILSKADFETEMRVPFEFPYDCDTSLGQRSICMDG